MIEHTEKKTLHVLDCRKKHHGIKQINCWVKIQSRKIFYPKS